jgi:pimeloyl-ACP methyl ester carboxylesterase
MSDDRSKDTITVGLSRREFVATASVIGGLVLPAAAPVRAAIADADFHGVPPYGNGTLPPGVRARLIPNVNGLTVNILETGFETPGRPLVLLLHGFPNLAYSWRKVMPALAAAGYYAVAPDCRGFGRTAGWDNSWDADPQPFLVLNMVRDQIALVYALGYRKTAMIVGHDQGSLLASFGALIRPDIFPRPTLIGGGFGGVPSFPLNTGNGAPAPHPEYTNAELDAEYAKLSPPRRGYQDYWASPEADEDMKHVPQGMTDFFRAFYYMKSADFPGNQNLQPLHAVHTAKEAAEQNAQIPEYYVMRRNRSMPATVAAVMPDARYIKACKWLTEAECEVYGLECAQRVDRRAARISAPAQQLLSSDRCRAADLLGPHHRHTRAGDCGKRRLGRQSNPGRPPQQGQERLHPIQGSPHGGASRSLGSGGAARAGERAFDRFLARVRLTARRFAGLG